MCLLSRVSFMYIFLYYLVAVWLTVPVHLIVWKKTRLQMTYYVLSVLLNSQYSLTVLV